MSLSDIHRQYLLNHAIGETLLARHGVRSEENEIVFLWRDNDLLTEQRRPWPGESGVYFWEKDKALHFWTLRDMGDDSPVLLVEGTKQSLAAATHAPHEYTVMGMAGCWGWIKAPLARFRDRRVFVCLDADAASNLDVYDAGEKLGEKLKRYGASTSYLRIPGTGSQGLDDYLASLPVEERADMLRYEIDNAAAKPAERRPTTRKRKMESDLPDLGDRVGVAINMDRKEVIDKITGALKDRHDGRDLFNYGEVITRVKGHETQPLDRDRFYAMLADAVACFRYTEATDKRPAIFEPAWPDPPSIGAVLSKAEEFSLLKRVVRVPFLRPDGSICTEPGYDAITHTVLVPSGLDTLAVPEAPTKAEVRLAARFLMTEWLGDMPFKTEADRANALALLLTPFMRGLVPLAPLAVVSGLQMGVGKNLLADVIHLLATGEVALPLPYVDSEEEMRKQLTASFSSGAEMFIFDEAHVVEGAQLSRAVTSITYGDRILGVSRIAKFPNAATWMSLGNQVQVNGDMARRVYFVYLHPSTSNVIDREAKEFRHPDLKLWTSENRTELVSAALTILRGWVVAGRPAYSRGACMGSFEPWDRMMSGVLAYAGHAGFLTDMKDRRSESDYTNSYWEAHVHWLHDRFGGEEFTTRQVQELAMRDPSNFEAPPGMEETGGKDYTRRLGQGYGKHRDRNYSGVRLVKAGMGHKSTIKWQTISENGGVEVSGGNPLTPPVAGEPLSESSRVDVPPVRGGSSVPSPYLLTSEQEEAFQELIDLRQEMEATAPKVLGFDLETASAEELFTGRHEGPFVRLAGATRDCEDYTGPLSDQFLGQLNRADAIYGHNIFGFDLLALAHHHGADYDQLAAKSIDTLVLARLLDPPTSKGMPNGYYKLDAVAQRLGVAGKTDNLKGLAKRYGGFDRIPLDSREYQEYLRGDLTATKAVHERLMSDLKQEPEAQQAYACREMEVVALQNRMTLNGWAIDPELLAERVAHEDAQRAAAVEILNRNYAVPLAPEPKFRMRAKAEWPEEYRSSKVYDLRALHSEQALVSMGLAYWTEEEPHKAPWATDAGRTALEGAFTAAGAPYAPRTKTGALALSSDALGDEPWYDKASGKSVPGLLQAYGDNAAVRRLVETILMATGARAKYAEIQKYVTPAGRVHAGIGDAQGSGRWAMTKPSITNIGVRGAAKEERAVLVADPGHVLVTVDASQVDMRAMAGLSQDSAYMALFAPGRDAHAEMSIVYFGDASPENRQRTKAINHKLNYGGGAKSTAEMNRIPLEVVEGAIAVRAETYPRLVKYIQEVRDMATSGVLLDNGFGRMMRPNPERAWTQGPALVGQGCARDIVCESILRLVKARPDVTPYLRGVVHDELVLSVPADSVEEWQEELRRAFTWEWRGVPILCEVGTPAYRWSDCK